MTFKVCSWHHVWAVHVHSPVVGYYASCWRSRCCRLNISNQPAFTAISSAGVPDAAAVDQQYLSYVSVTWLESTVWSADNLSVYSQHVHTNNDMEEETDMA